MQFSNKIIFGNINLDFQRKIILWLFYEIWLAVKNFSTNQQNARNQRCAILFWKFIYRNGHFQCDQNGLILKYLGIFWKNLLLRWNLMWQLFGEIWLIYIPSSGHTGSFRWFNCSCGLDCCQSRGLWCWPYNPSVPHHWSSKSVFKWIRIKTFKLP